MSRRVLWGRSISLGPWQFILQLYTVDWNIPWEGIRIIHTFFTQSKTCMCTHTHSSRQDLSCHFSVSQGGMQYRPKTSNFLKRYDRVVNKKPTVVSSNCLWLHMASWHNVWQALQMSLRHSTTVNIVILTQTHTHVCTHTYTNTHAHTHTSSGALMTPVL